jgi:hypothetical protein
MDTPALPMDTPLPDTPPAPRCMGSAVGCGTLDEAGCPSVMGCAVTSCRGFPVDCDRLRTMTECSGQRGCAWSGTTCTGTPAPCNTLADGAECTGQMGCTMGMRSCGGLPTPCSVLSDAQCEMQPGCYRMPDAGFDGGPPDAPPLPCDPGTTPIALRVVDAAGAPMAGVAVRAEGESCGVGFETTTAADGTATFMVDPALGPWSITAARAGHAAVSVLDVLGTAVGAFDGDMRLDPLRTPETYDPFAVSGSLGGTIGIGHTVQVDAYDFDTIPAAGASWSSNFYVSGVTTPLRFVALELDAAGDAVNFAMTAESMRSRSPLTGVVLTLPTPAEAPRPHTLSVTWPTTGLLADAMPVRAACEHLLPLPTAPFVFAGSARISAATPGSFTVSVRDFSPLPANLVFVTVQGTALSNLYWWGDVADDARTVGALDTLTFGGVSLADAAATARATDWGYAALHIGEGTNATSGWRVFGALDRAGAADTNFAVPHLPTGVTLADIGLTGSVSSLFLAIETDGARPWSLQNANHGVPGYRQTAALDYIMIDASGR